ncbi:hypothetical protein TNCV_3160761 [Trichonephila clavipes]|nr:hypothetical protein TNCV_3160761 [Trichonephila clavipes]
MALSTDHTTKIEYQNVSLPSFGKNSPEPPTRPISCARLEATKVDIRRYTLIVQGYENKIAALRHSNTQDEHEPTFVEMVERRVHYENLLENAVSEYGNLPYCDTLGCPVHETPTTFPIKTQATKRKDKDGYTSPLPSKTFKSNVSNQEKFKLN